MRAVVQRVRSARVEIEGEVVGSIGPGILALVGVGQQDGEADAEDLAKRMVNLRIFPDEEGRMNRSLLDVGGSVLVVSQFTLYGDARKGRRPYFGDAAASEDAAPLVESVVRAIRAFDVEVECGRFQAHMEVQLTNDGPVTILLDSEKLF